MYPPKIHHLEALADLSVRKRGSKKRDLPGSGNRVFSDWKGMYI